MTYFTPYTAMSVADKDAFDSRQGIAPGNRARIDAKLGENTANRTMITNTDAVSTYSNAESVLRVFEVTAAGFDASTDETDNLVFWVAAKTAEAVQNAIQNTGANYCGEVSGSSLPDADFTLPSQSLNLTSALLKKASDYRNRSRATPRR